MTTVIHRPEEDQTLLYRWMARTLERGPMVWIIAGVVIVAIGLAWIITAGASSARSAACSAPAG